MAIPRNLVAALTAPFSRPPRAGIPIEQIGNPHFLHLPVRQNLLVIELFYLRGITL